MLNLELLKVSIFENLDSEVSMKLRREEKDELFFAGTIKSPLFKGSLVYMGLRITSSGYIDVRFDFLDKSVEYHNCSRVNYFNADDLSHLIMCIIEDNNGVPFIELKGQSIGVDLTNTAIKVFHFYLQELKEDEVIRHLEMLGAI